MTGMAASGGKGRRLRDGAQMRSLATGAIFALVLGTVGAQHWLASLPAPWGGPNVIIAGAAALAAALYAAAELLRTARREPGRALDIRGLAGRWRAAMGLTPAALGALAVCGLMTAWALAVYLWNGNLEVKEWGKLAMGGGVLLAVCVAVNGAWRPGALLLAIVLAVWASALFGLALAVMPEPLAYWWVAVADPAERTIGVVVTEGRTAGLAVETAIFGQQVAVAIPLALAALAVGAATWFPSFGAAAPRHWRWAGTAALAVILATLTIALATNGTRSAEYSTAVGVIAGLPLLWRVRHCRRRLLWSLGLGGLCLLAVFNPVFAVGDLADRIGAAVDSGGSAGNSGGAAGIDYGAAQSGGGNAEGAVFANLEAGSVCGAAATTPRRCYRIRGVNNRRTYAVQLRARLPEGYGREIGEVTTQPNPARIMVSWDQAADPGIAGYEFRLRQEGATGFTPWRELAGGGERERGMTINADDAKMAALRTALDLSEFEDDRSIASLYAFRGWSLRSRLYQSEMAFRYARDYPLGAGRYAPQESHLGVELDARRATFLLNNTIHNQFLRTLTLYGYPGLLLLGALYALAAWSLGRAAVTTWRRGCEGLLALTAAVGMALTAYLAVSMLNAPGPFAGDWSHFLLLGLAFGVAGIVRHCKGQTEENQS